MGKNPTNQTQQPFGQGANPTDYIMAIAPALIKGIAGGIAGESPGMGALAGLTQAIPAALDVRTQGRELDAKNAAEMARRGVNKSMFGMGGMEQGMQDALAAASPEQAKAVMDVLGAQGAQRYTNNFMTQMGFDLPESGPGIPGESYQSSLLGQLGPTARQAYSNPTAEQINELSRTGQMPSAADVPLMERLRGGVPAGMGTAAMQYSPANPDAQLKKAVMPSAIGATQARNQADIQTAVPMAQAKLTGENLSNQGQVLTNEGRALTNEGIPAKNAGQNLSNTGKRLDNRKMELLINEHLKEQADLADIEDFQKTLQDLAGKEQDPIEFRKKALFILQKAPVPNEAMKSAMEDIEGMAMVKEKSVKQSAPPSNPLDFMQGLFGGQPSKPKPKGGLYGVGR